MNPHDQLVDWIDGVVSRADGLADIAQGNHCLTRADGPWTRKIALYELFCAQYNEKTIRAMLELLEPDNKTEPMTGREIFEFQTITT